MLLPSPLFLGKQLIRQIAPITVSQSPQQVFRTDPAGKSKERVAAIQGSAQVKNRYSHIVFSAARNAETVPIIGAANAEKGLLPCKKAWPIRAKGSKNNAHNQSLLTSFPEK